MRQETGVPSEVMANRDERMPSDEGNKILDEDVLMPKKIQKKHARPRPRRHPQAKSRKARVATAAVIPVALEKNGRTKVDSAVIPVTLTDVKNGREDAAAAHSA